MLQYRERGRLRAVQSPQPPLSVLHRPDGKNERD